MNNLLLYLVKAAAGTILLYLFYLLFFNRDTFCRRNRLLLLAVLTVPLVVPVLKIIFSPVVSGSGSYFAVVNVLLSASDQVNEALAVKIRTFSIEEALFLLYLVTGMFFLARSFTGIFKTLGIIKKGSVISRKFPFVILTGSEYPAFSFFPYIAIPKHIYDSGDYECILEHEKAHIRQLHSVDVILCELVIAFQWFNPVVWLVKRKIVLNHEYMADRAYLDHSPDTKEYQYRLLNLPAQYNKIQTAHTFSSSIKNRLVMINKKPTPEIAKLKNILLIPVFAILFLLFSFRNYQEHQLSANSNSEVLKYLAQNISYPAEAKNAVDTGTVYVAVTVAKGGTVKDTKAFLDKKQVRSELFQEIVVVGYLPKPADKKISTATDHPVLKQECVKMAKQLTTLNIPEWKDKSAEFTLAFKFILK